MLIFRIAMTVVCAAGTGAIAASAVMHRSIRHITADIYDLEEDE